MAISRQEIEEQASGLVKSTLEHFKELRRKAKLVQEWQAAENSYFNGTDDFYNGISKVRVPALHQAVERIVPKMDKVIFPPDGDFFASVAKDERDDISVEDANAVTALIKQQFKDVGTRSKLISSYRSLCIYGTSWISTFWEKRVQERWKRVNGKRERVADTVFDNPDFTTPSIWDVYIDPKDEDLQGWLIERVVVDYSSLWSMRRRKEGAEEVGIYDNVEKLKDVSIAIDSDDDKRESDENTRLASHTYGPHEQKVELYKAWGNIPKWMLTGSQKDKEEKTVIKNALIEVAGSDDSMVVLRIIDNPFDHQEKPYFRGRYIKVSGRAYGLGVMSVNIPLEAELNTLRNQLTDLRTTILKKKWLKDRNANITDAQLKDLHNSVIETDLMSGLRDIVPADFSPSAGIQMDRIMQDIEDSTGASKLLSGIPSGGSLDRTAAGVATVVQGGLERFELIVTQYEEEVLKTLVRHFWMLNQQFLPEGRDVALTGKGIIRVVPEEIPFEGFDLNFIGIRELGEKEFKINALNILLQNLSPFIPLGLDPIPVVLRFFKLVGMGDLSKEVDKRPEAQLEDSPEGEVLLLRQGRNVKINLNDNHDAYIAAYQQLLQEPNLPDNVTRNILEATGQRLLAKQIIETGVKRTNVNQTEQQG